MAFHEVRLPEEIEIGAQGGPAFNTSIISLSSGFEQRNINWEQARLKWDIGYGVMGKDGLVDEISMDRLIAFFYAREGRAHGFRFKDWTDFELVRSVIGLTDGANASFQIIKRYTSGFIDHDRQITKIVNGSVSVWVDNVLITQGVGDSQYQINLNTGLITLGVTLASQIGTNVEVQCEFDVPVRFDTDQLSLNVFLFNASSIPNIQIVEIRVDDTGNG